MVRYFITHKLKRGLPYVPQLSRRLCGEHSADHIHIFWHPVKINKYWADVWNGLKVILGNEPPKTGDVL